MHVGTDVYHSLIADVRGIAQEVAGKLADVLLVQYPSLRDTIRVVAARVLNEAVEEATKKVNDLLAREKDPFTMNDFLQQWVNKLRFDRFNEAVNTCFENAKTPARYTASTNTIYIHLNSAHYSLLTTHCTYTVLIDYIFQQLCCFERRSISGHASMVSQHPQRLSSRKCPRYVCYFRSILESFIKTIYR